MAIESTHLGKQSSYPQHYDPSVLVAVPRILNRQQYGLFNEALPFSGVDVWHAYEFSFLLENGVPVTGILKLVYPCNNEYLVESKSLKLYLNSFNMDRFGSNKTEGIQKTTGIIRRDLSALLNTEVRVSCFDHQQAFASDDFKDYHILEDFTDPGSLNCTQFTETPDLLGNGELSGEFKWGSHLLRSNCKITYQPDWGSIFIAIKGTQVPTAENLLTYLISLRNENHFHEEICEMVFKRLLDRFSPEALTVTCLYTRRGGIDINPVRSLDHKNMPVQLIASESNDSPQFRQ